ncbi:hypothetical protein AGMMS49592_0710 [Endomicrobiia bacterium]|nr:hypothetical protein AGMMS49592_0710 [Endomicrobiia bacterium]
MYSSDNKGVEKNYRKALSWFAKSAERGNAKAQYNLGKMYYFGEGVARDHRQAFSWYKKAAEQGDANAQYCTGMMCYNGEGVAKDYKEAMKWYLKSSEQGHAEAQYRLEWMCYNDEGIGKDGDCSGSTKIHRIPLLVNTKLQKHVKNAKNQKLLRANKGRNERVKK